MRIALVLAAALLTRTASAQPGATPPVEPAPAPAPPAPTTPEPKGDPAYGEQPDHAMVDASNTQNPGLRTSHGIVVRYTPSRTTHNITVLAVLAGSSLVLGGIGLYFHFDARSLADEVSAKTFTGHAWTQERQGIYDDAQSSATIAKVAYSVGAALLLTTAVVYMVTEPSQKEMVVNPKAPPPTAMVAPTHGGAIVGGVWSF